MTKERPIRAVLLAAAIAGLTACGSDPPSSERPEAVRDPGPTHIHGLGINPKDRALYLATHTGLFRAPEGEQQAVRVGDRYQDTMGFTIAGPDRFLGSGHPDGRDRLPPFLGLIRSTDAGRTWEPVSLLGEADFHVLEAAGPRVYGFGSDFKTRRSRFLVSSDGGRSWVERDVPSALAALAIDPADPEHVVASNGTELYTSADAGRHWRRLPGPGGLLAWSRPAVLSLVTGRGAAALSEDGGRSWRRVGRAGGQPAALDASAEELLVALHDGTVKSSRDGGRTWRVRVRP